jgi:hypothetical protein
MGVSYQTGTLVRTGEERATLVRRTYGLVLVSVLVTMVGASFGLSQPNLMAAVAQHPFIAFFASLVPLLLATRKADFPFNIESSCFNFMIGAESSGSFIMVGRSRIDRTGRGSDIGAFGVPRFTRSSAVAISAPGQLPDGGQRVLIGTMLLNLFFTIRQSSVAGVVTVILFRPAGVSALRLRNTIVPKYVGAAVKITWIHSTCMASAVLGNSATNRG